MTRVTKQPTRAPGLRPLGLPRPLRVRTDAHGEPAELTLPPRGPGGRHGGGRGRTLAVERVEEVWRIVEEWWREAPLARTYYRVVVDGGRSLTLFHDDDCHDDGLHDDDCHDDGCHDDGHGEGWYEQQY